MKSKADRTTQAAAGIITLAEHIRPLKIISLISRNRECKTYLVAYASGDELNKQLLLRSFLPGSADYSHLESLHRSTEAVPCIPKPLYMADGNILYHLPSRYLSEEDFTSEKAHRLTRTELKQQLEKVKQVAMSMDALHESGVFYQTPELRHMVYVDGKICFWNFDTAQLVDPNSKEAVALRKKNISFLGRLLSLSLLNHYPAYEAFQPENFTKTDLANQIVSAFCTLLAVQETELLFHILQKSLGRKDTYATAERFAADLNELQKLLMQESSDYKVERHLDWAAANFLNQNPLYPYVNQQSQTLDVVLVGSGPMRDIFFEQIFASVQIPDIQLRLHIVSNDVLDFDLNYTIGGAEKSPALAKAVKVTRVGYESDDVPLDQDILGDNPPLAEIVLYQKRRLPPAKELTALNPGCVLFFQKVTNQLRSLTRDLISQSKAPLLVGIATDQQLDRSGLGVNKNVTLRTFPRNGLAFSTEQWESSPIYQRALNIHTYYEKDANERVSQREILQHFKEAYSTASSLRSALAIPYKLYVCGLQDDDNAAFTFYEKYVCAAGNNPMMDRLVWLEHRSWQAFMLVNGWDLLPMEKLPGYLFADTNLLHNHKDSAKKLHACLYASSNDPDAVPLAQKPLETWDSLDASQLDGLDQLSLQMYRMFCHQVQTKTTQDFSDWVEKEKNSNTGLPLHKLSRLQLGFSQLLSNATNAEQIWNLMFQDAVDSLDSEKQELLKSLASVVSKRNAHRDFKQSDQAVIEAIPQMLQGSTVKCVYKLYSPQAWDNVASSVFVEPEQLVLVVDESCGNIVKEQLPTFREFLKLRSLDTTISFVYIDQLGSLPADAVLDVTGADARQVYAAQSHDLLSRLPVICYHKQLLQSPNNSFPQIRFFQRNRSLSVQEMLVLGGAHMYEAEYVPLSLDEYQRLWRIAQSCTHQDWNYYNTAVTELLDVTQDGENIKSSSKWNIFADMGSRQFNIRLPEKMVKESGFADLLQLLEINGLIQRVNLDASKDSLCVIAKDPYHQASLNKVLEDITKKIQTKPGKYSFDVKWFHYERKYVVFVSGAWNRQWEITKEVSFWKTSCSLKQAKDSGLFDFLRQLEMQDAIAPIGEWGSRKDKCTYVIAKDPFLQKKLNQRLDDLFCGNMAGRKTFSVMVTRDFSSDTAQRINIEERTLKRKRESLSITKDLISLLEKLAHGGFIQPIDANLPVYSQETKLLQFAYTSEACRESLHTEGAVLELFAYHAIRQTGLFDDVRLSVKIRWEKDNDHDANTTNEIDLICVKGTRSYFISCKKTSEIRPSYLTEIRYEADRFGVDSTAILLTTAKQEKNVATYNRAKRMGIQVITLRDYTEKNHPAEDSIATLRKALEAIL